MCWLLPLGAAELPPLPANGLHDEGRLLNTEQTRTVVAAIDRARQQEIDLFVVTFPFIIGEQTLKERAEAMYRAWCRREFGLVIAMDATSNDCRFFADPSETSSLLAATISRLCADAVATSAALPTPGARLTGMVEDLAPRLAAAVAPFRAPPAADLGLQEWLVFTSIAAAAVGLLLFAWGGRRVVQRLAPAAPLYFPEVMVGSRFGAAFAGGVVARIDFRASGNGGATSPKNPRNIGP